MMQLAMILGIFLSFSVTPYAGRQVEEADNGLEMSDEREESASYEWAVEGESIPSLVFCGPCPCKSEEEVAPLNIPGKIYWVPGDCVLSLPLTLRAKENRVMLISPLPTPLASEKASAYSEIDVTIRDLFFVFLFVHEVNSKPSPDDAHWDWRDPSHCMFGEPTPGLTKCGGAP